MSTRGVVVAGGGPLAVSLAARLPGARLVSRRLSPTEGWRADLTSIPEAEVACAGASTVVVLAQARRPPARLTRADLGDLDRLLADSLARAAQRCGVDHVVLFACGEADVREGLLRAAGRPLSVLRGGGPDPVAALEALVRRGPGPDVVSPGWTGEAVPAVARPEGSVCSVQRFRAPTGWDAEQLAKAYLEWLPGQVPTVRVTLTAEAATVHAFGARALMLRFDRGRSEADACVLEVADGALVRRAPTARFEFRRLLDGSAALCALVGFEPALPWPVYYATQALVHERVMRRFTEWLARQGR